MLLLDFKMFGQELLKNNSLVWLSMVSMKEKKKKGKKEKKLEEKGTGEKIKVKAF